MDGGNLRFGATAFQVERLRVVIHPDRGSVGLTAAEAVYRTLVRPISTGCPASILRQHAGAVVHLDPFSAARVRDLID